MTTAPASAQHVEAGPWSGGVVSDAATVVAKLNTPRLSTLEVSADPYFSRFVTFGEETSRPGDQPEMSRFRAIGLKPSTRYYYRIRAGSVRDERQRGTFTTLPLEGKPASFRFVFSAGATAGANHSVFAEIKSADPLFYIVAGNLHDAVAGATSRAEYRTAYEQVLASLTQGDLYLNVPIVYTWDAYDYGPAGGAVPPRAAAHAAFREYVPYHALADSASPDAPINRAFTVGRVRFLVLDVRTERGPAGTSLLGERQREWLKAELLAAKGRNPLIFVVSPSAWLSPAEAGRDDWGRFPEERTALSDWITENAIKGICFLTGDGSVLAADDGSHNTYGTLGGPGFPVLQAGPLDRSRTTGTGPWSAGPVSPESGEGFFAIVEVADTGDAVSVSYRGTNQHGHRKLAFTFSVPGL